MQYWKEQSKEGVNEPLGKRTHDLRMINNERRTDTLLLQKLTNQLHQQPTRNTQQLQSQSLPQDQTFHTRKPTLSTSTI